MTSERNRPMIRCMGPWPSCRHLDNTCTACPAYQNAIKAKKAAATPPVQGEAVGVAGTMPGTTGFTMASFRADDVPVGTKLYTAPPPVTEGVREGIYVASRASTPDRPAMWRAFRDEGFPIISTWIDEAGAGETACLTGLWKRIEREVTGARALVLYAEPDDFPLKGALIEVGMAIAAGVPVRVVVPGVDLDPVSIRPLGSWAKHPLVSFHESARAALTNPGGEG
jgi:hypothetical protein